MTHAEILTTLRSRLQLALGSKYEVGDEIGRGGMSRVFAAHDLTLKRDIVIKTLPPELAGDISIERFQQEIHFAASLQHPHIVPVHAAGDVDGLPYFTMPRVEGESLRERLNRVQRLPVNEVLAVMRDVARALAYAHRRGLVHRDIKPENILVAEGVAMVTDFGIAKAVAAARREEHDGQIPTASATATTGLTLAGTWLGTPNYAAPEQAAGDPATDHRADLYAFGVVAYELFCGQTPTAARSVRGANSAASMRPPDVASQRLDVPPLVAQLVMQCLAVEPDNRPRSADTLLKGLEAAMSATPLAPVGDDPSVTRKAFAWYAVAFVLATGLAWAAMIGLGLPDWVFPGAMIIMALGLPVVTTAALARRAAFQSSFERHAEVSRVGWLFTPGPMTTRLAQALTWRRVVTGGGASLGAFGLLVVGFMTTRALGVGPAGSLLAKGQIARHQPILVADFASAPGDSNIARLAREAAIVGFDESNVVSVMTPASLTEALGRMRRPTTEHVTPELARAIARREGIGVIAEGEVHREGDGFLLRLRLVGADSGQVLASRQTIVKGAVNLLPAIDQVTRDVRARIGESLKLVRSSTPLEKATTASFDALLLYTQAERAYSAGDPRKSRELLLRALEFDSTFAIAWRKLYIATGYSRPAPPGGWRPRAGEALDSAFKYRTNASMRERLAIEGQYYWSRANDRPRAIAAYDESAIRTRVPNHNHAWFLIALHQYARSESLFRVILSVNPNPLSYKGFFWAIMNQGKHREAESVARVATARFPEHEPLQLEAVFVHCGVRQFQTCEAGLDSVRTQSRNTELVTLSLYSQADLALMRGKVSQWQRLSAEAVRSAGRQLWLGSNYARSALIDLVVRHRPDDAVTKLNSIENPTQRANQLQLYALAGQVDSARSILDAITTAAPDSTLRLWPLAMRRFDRASAAVALGQWQVAIDHYRLASRLEDGFPRPTCTECTSLEIGRVFDMAGSTDSAIYFYERFLTTPQYNPHPSEFGAWMGFIWWQFVNEAWIRERLGDLYEKKGDRQNAIRHFTAFVDLWKDADPELQPRVTAARNRLAALRAS